MKSLYEKLNGSYIVVGNAQIPALISTNTNYEIAFWGQSQKILYNIVTK